MKNDLTGKKYGLLSVKGFSHRDKSSRQYWKVSCTCGRSKVVEKFNLISGRTFSCGCQKNKLISEGVKSHGMRNTRFYRVWDSIKQKCLNKNSSAYYKYGNEGVSVCKDWMVFENFKKDMYESYVKHAAKYGEKNTTIERIDVYGNYEKANCCWVTKKLQARNKRNTIYVNYKNRKVSIPELSEITGIKSGTLYHKINRGEYTKI